ncbi:hypothetical protein EJ03DRAFT_100771 [Teratosphaeria nubilosa]|uniref:Uncharacterized protein n=1 Tax=Teratosphaeria nubilosa TaxID=161662 RepID=A0A6G1LLL4_9PEZI|nr:hypothetical protein EJ03DRAFT_100771 [Teratosphaeria nubilosa]
MDNGQVLTCEGRRWVHTRSPVLVYCTCARKSRGNRISVPSLRLDVCRMEYRLLSHRPGARHQTRHAQRLTVCLYRPLHPPRTPRASRLLEPRQRRQHRSVGQQEPPDHPRNRNRPWAHGEVAVGVGEEVSGAGSPDDASAVVSLSSSMEPRSDPTVRFFFLACSFDLTLADAAPAANSASAGESGRGPEFRGARWLRILQALCFRLLPIVGQKFATVVIASQGHLLPLGLHFLPAQGRLVCGVSAPV